jgi:hypothetical protein
MDENEIAAVRRIRHEISEECNHDVERVIAYYRSVQEELKRSGQFRFAKSATWGALAGHAGEGRCQ